MNRKLLFIIIIAFSILGIISIFLINPQTSFDKLSISEEDWNSIVSSKSVGDIALKSIQFNDYNLIIDEENKKIYYSVIKNSSNKFSPLVSFSANTSNAKIAFLNDEINENKIMNNHEFKMLLYDNNSYSIYGLYCTSFPMINIMIDDTNSKKASLPMSMYLFNNFENGINRSVRSDGSISTIEMEDGTNNYKFSLIMTTPGNNERENVISLLHMKPSNEYFLNAINIGENTSPLKPIKEPNVKMIDNEFDKKLSGDNVKNFKEREEQRIELFINNKYIGLYSLTSNPDNNIKYRNK